MEPESNTQEQDEKRGRGLVRLMSFCLIVAVVPFFIYALSQLLNLLGVAPKLAEVLAWALIFSVVTVPAAIAIFVVGFVVLLLIR